MRCVFFVVVLGFVALACGCVCCGSGGGESSTTLVSTTTLEVVCDAPYMRYGDGCCLDVDQNNVCDREESTTESSVLESSTTLESTSTVESSSTSTSTTAPAESCYDGLRNQNEVFVDCGGICQSSCGVFNLTRGGAPVGYGGYNFTLEDTEIVRDAFQYTLEITTPDGFVDERQASLGYQSWIDGVKFKIEEGGEVRLTFWATVDEALKQAVPDDATIKTIGGKSCLQLAGGICTRSYGGYSISMINRVDGGGVKFRITKPDGLDVQGTAYENGTRFVMVGSGGLIVGVADYMIPGGYSNIYVKGK